MDPRERELWVRLAASALPFDLAQRIVTEARQAGWRGLVVQLPAPGVEFAVNLDRIAADVAREAVGTASQKGD